ncbi:MAG: enoyl-CoA hydratase/isomerase family protein, partial [Planctomycetota bacterium]
MAEPIVKVRVDECSGTIILNRPAKRNALSRNMLADITQGFRDLHGQKKVRAVILASSDRVFSSGYDVAEMHEIAQPEIPDFQRLHEDATAFRDLLMTMLQFPKPIIATISGPTIGAGVGLALASDIVLASSAATFSVPAPRRGIVAGMVAPL